MTPDIEAAVRRMNAPDIEEAVEYASKLLAQMFERQALRTYRARKEGK